MKTLNFKTNEAVAIDSRATFSSAKAMEADTILKNGGSSKFFMICSKIKYLGYLAIIAMHLSAANTSCNRDVTVMFNSNGGSDVEAQIVKQGKRAVEPDAPTRERYNFDGWFIDNNSFRNKWYFATNTVVDDITLFAKWQEITFTVTFNSNGGSAVAPRTVTHSNRATKPADPTREGFVFDGWFTDNNTFANEWNFSENTVTKNVTLFAKWIVQYTVTFNSNGGNAISAQTFLTVGKASKPADPTRAGFVFGGWFRDNNTFTNEWNFTTNAVTASVTLYAKWNKVKLLETIIISDRYKHFVKFEYDSQNRITKISNYTFGNHFWTETLLYSGNDLVSSWRGSFFQTYTKIGKQISFGGDNENRIDLDSEGYPIKYEFPSSFDDSPIVINFKFQGGNMTMVDRDDYTYDNNKSPLVHCVSPEWWFILFWRDFIDIAPYASKNNVIKIKRLDGEIIEYTNKYDSDGYPIERTERSSWTGESVVKFQYK